jgi:hypothetical protein
VTRNKVGVRSQDEFQFFLKITVKITMLLSFQKPDFHLDVIHGQPLISSMMQCSEKTVFNFVENREIT